MKLKHGGMDTWRPGSMETWKSGDVKTWTQSHEHGGMDMETWTWIHELGDMDINMDMRRLVSLLNKDVL